MLKYIAYGLGASLLAVGGFLASANPEMGGAMILVGLIVAFAQLRAQRNSDMDVQDSLQMLYGYSYASTGNSPWVDQALRMLRRGRAPRTVALTLGRREAEHVTDTRFHWLLAALWAMQASVLQHRRGTIGQPVDSSVRRARHYATRGLAIDPQDPALLIAKGVILDLEGDHEQAQVVFRQCGLLPGCSWWRRPLILSLSYSQKWGDAINQIRILQAAGAHDWPFYYYSSAIYMGTGRLNLARWVLRRAALQRPRNPLVLDALRQAAYWSGHYNEAVRTEWTLVFKAPRWILVRPRRLAEAVAHSLIIGWCALTRFLGRAQAQPFVTLGQVAFSHGFYWQSAVLYRMAFHRSGAIDWLANSGAALVRAEHISYAIRVLKRVLGQEPTHPQALHNLQTLTHA